MSKEAWLYIKPAAWAAIDPGPEPETKEIWHYLYRNAKSGFWNDFTGGFRVYNVPASNQVQIQALIDQFNPADVARVYAWIQGPGYDDLDAWPTDPTDILAVMKDHPGPVPPTLENPNWGHVFFGQSERIFAGDFSNDFNGDFR